MLTIAVALLASSLAAGAVGLFGSLHVTIHIAWILALFAEVAFITQLVKGSKVVQQHTL